MFLVKQNSEKIRALILPLRNVSLVFGTGGFVFIIFLDSTKVKIV